MKVGVTALVSHSILLVIGTITSTGYWAVRGQPSDSSGWDVALRGCEELVCDDENFLSNTCSLDCYEKFTQKCPGSPETYTKCTGKDLLVQLDSSISHAIKDMGASLMEGRFRMEGLQELLSNHTLSSLLRILSGLSPLLRFFTPPDSVNIPDVIRTDGVYDGAKAEDVVNSYMNDLNRQQEDGGEDRAEDDELSSVVKMFLQSWMDGSFTLIPPPSHFLELLGDPEAMEGVMQSVGVDLGKASEGLATDGKLDSVVTHLGYLYKFLLRVETAITKSPDVEDNDSTSPLSAD